MTLNAAVVAIAVLIDYEFLQRVSAAMPTVLLRHRLRIVVGVFMGLIVHTVEIWLFGLVYYLMHQMDGWGWLTGSCDGSLLDCVYFQFTAFSTLGFGDIAPVGDLRFPVAPVAQGWVSKASFC